MTNTFSTRYLKTIFFSPASYILDWDIIWRAENKTKYAGKNFIKIYLEASRIYSDLWFYTSTNSIYAPISSVIVVKVNFAESNTRMSLTCSIEETVMDCHTNAPICDLRTTPSDQHCFVVLREVTSTRKNKTMSFLSFNLQTILAIILSSLSVGNSQYGALKITLKQWCQYFHKWCQLVHRHNHENYSDRSICASIGA